MRAGIQRGRCRREHFDIDNGVFDKGVFFDDAALRHACALAWERNQCGKDRREAKGVDGGDAEHEEQESRSVLFRHGSGLGSRLLETPLRSLRHRPN